MIIMKVDLPCRKIKKNCRKFFEILSIPGLQNYRERENNITKNIESKSSTPSLDKRGDGNRYNYISSEAINSS